MLSLKKKTKDFAIYMCIKTSHCTSYFHTLLNVSYIALKLRGIRGQHR